MKNVNYTILLQIISFVFVPLFSHEKQVPLHWDENWNVTNTGSPWTLAVVLATAHAATVFTLVLAYKAHASNLKRIGSESVKYNAKPLLLIFFAIAFITFSLYHILQYKAHHLDLNLLNLVIIISICFWSFSPVMVNIKQNIYIGFRTSKTLTDAAEWAKQNKALYAITTVICLIAFALFSYIKLK